MDAILVEHSKKWVTGASADASVTPANAGINLRRVSERKYKFSLEEDGRHYPTDGFMVWPLHQAIYREPLYWPQRDNIIPERWLVDQDDPLHPVKGAWRGFELGPCNCIGQEFAVLEMKLVMVMTLREFDARSSYEEWDRTRGKPGLRNVSGERAYQILDGITRPADGLPCRVSVAT